MNKAQRRTIATVADQWLHNCGSWSLGSPWLSGGLVKNLFIESSMLTATVWCRNAYILKSWIWRNLWIVLLETCCLRFCNHTEAKVFLANALLSQKILTLLKLYVRRYLIYFQSCEFRIFKWPINRSYWQAEIHISGILCNFFSFSTMTNRFFF